MTLGQHNLYRAMARTAWDRDRAEWEKAYRVCFWYAVIAIAAVVVRAVIG